jgi:hypothetical protein
LVFRQSTLVAAALRLLIGRVDRALLAIAGVEKALEPVAIEA